MNTEADNRLRVRLQIASLTQVTPELRSVSADADPATRMIHLRFVFAREPSDSERDAASIAGTNVLAAYPGTWDILEEYLVVPANEPMSHLRLLVYHRCEDDWVGPDS